MGTQLATLHTSSQHKLVVQAAAGTTAPPVASGAGGAAYPSSWNIGGFRVRFAMLRFTAAAALNMTAISVWVDLDGVWSKLTTIADITFAAGDLVRIVPIEWPVGARIAVAYTASASTVAVDAYPIESCE